MILLEVFDLKKYYGDRLILNLPELRIYSGDKIGIVGENGAGKTTLMDLLAGEAEPDQGVVKRNGSFSYLRQFSGGIKQDCLHAPREFLPKDRLSHSRLSGGEQTRRNLDNAFAQNSSLFFADEPTSNLDSAGIKLLTQKLKALDSFIIISHDRQLLDTVCNRILELREGAVTEYMGNYSAYSQQKKAERKLAETEYKQYSEERERLLKAVVQTKEKARSIRKAPRRMGNSEARLHKRASSEIQEKLHGSTRAIESRLERLEKKEKPRETPQIQLDFSLTNPPENKIVITCRSLSFGYGENQLFQNASFEIKNHTRTAVVAENGMGKTTLFQLISEAHSAIRLVPKVKLGYFRQNFEHLNSEKSVLENAMQNSVQPENTVRTILARLLFRGETVHKKAAVLSGGEKIKLSLAQLLVSDANVLLLDEPTNYLDIPSIEAMQSLLSDYPGVLLFVSHDQQFVNSVANRLLILKNKKILSFEGNLESYEKQILTPKPHPASTNKMVLEMRLTRILSELSLPGADRDALEEEYQQVQKQLNNLKSGEFH